MATESDDFIERFFNAGRGEFDPFVLMVEGSISNEESNRELLVRLWRQIPLEVFVYKQPAGFECHLVPIDACYELMGRVRRHWKGFSGGDEAWSEIEAFFATARRRGTVDATGEIG